MGMFGKNENMEQDIKRIESEAISSIIDKTMTIKGEVCFKGKARIDGTIEGNIDGEHLVLSDTGRILGDIRVTSFNCFGSIEGNVKANMVTARKECTIHGKLEASSLTVEPGATIQGELKVTSESQKKTPTLVKPSSPAAKAEAN